MKIIINLEFCNKIWKSDIKKVKEPYRTKQLREFCTKLVHENNKTLTLLFRFSEGVNFTPLDFNPWRIRERGVKNNNCNFKWP